MAAYSLDLRKRIVDAVKRGVASKREIARMFGVHETFVHKLLRQKRGRGDIAPLPHGGSLIVAMCSHSYENRRKSEEIPTRYEYPRISVFKTEYTD